MIWPFTKALLCQKAAYNPLYFSHFLVIVPSCHALFVNQTTQNILPIKMLASFIVVQAVKHFSFRTCQPKKFLQNIMQINFHTRMGLLMRISSG